MINSDDPRLTAYVFGELDDADRSEVESALAESPELQAEVDSIRQTAALLEDGLQTESAPALTDSQRAAIHEESSAPSVELADRSKDRKHGRRRRYAAAITMAGILALFLVPFALREKRMRTEHMENDIVSWLPRSESDRTPSKSAPLDSSDGAEDFEFEVDDNVTWAGDVDAEGERREDQGPDVSIGLTPNGRPSADFDFSFTQDSFRNKSPTFGGVDANAPLAPRFDVSELEADGFDDGGFGFDAPVEELARPGVSSDRSGGGVRGMLRGGRQSWPEEGKESMEMGMGGMESVEGVPTVRASGLEQSSGMGRSVPRKGLAAADSRTRQPGAPDAEQMLDEELAELPSDNFSERSLGTKSRAAQATLQAAQSELNESIDVKERAPNLVPEEQVRGEGIDRSRAVDVDLVVERSAPVLTSPESRGGEVSNKEEGKLGGLTRPPVKRTWRRAQATPNASRLVVGDRDELLMEGMQANVMVDGFRARVLLDLYYYNDRSRQLEGNFKLRLPNDASLYYFAFGESAYEYRPQIDQLASKGFLNGELVRAAGLSPKGILEAREGSWSKVKEARVVPREKAAHAYSETVRRRVDPALVEWSGAGMFNARVFPLMPKKLHRIVVGYDVNLQQVGDDLVYHLDLPEDVAQCMVDLNVSALPGTTADIQPTTRPFVSGGRAYYHFDEVKDNSIDLRYSGTGPVLLKGKDAQAGEFFAARVTPQLPAGEMQAGAERATFLVDTSLSARPDKFNVWLNLMESVLTKNRETLKRFSVLFFSIDSHWWKEAEVDNTAANVDALMTYCHSLSLEGATDLRQALREASAPSWADKDVAETAARDLFLLSDGAVTWGEMNPHLLSESLTAEQTVFAYQTGMTGTATSTLEHLTRETGGAVFAIVNEDEIPAVATAHRNRPWKLNDISMAGGTDLLVAGRPQFIYPGQSLLVVGRGDPDAEVMLILARGKEDKNLSIMFERVVESDLAARAYGQVAVGQLEDLGSSLEDVSVAYARHFRVTGQTCSLLMLESEADYQRFNIKPQDDLFVVRSTPPAGLITKKLDELSEQLGDAKAHVVAWLDKLQSTAGFEFELPTALRLAIDRLPQSAFDVAPPRLICESHSRGDFPKEFIEQLNSGKLEYDAVTAQANSIFKQHGAANGLKMLSSLIEQNPGDPVLTRDVAYSAIEWDLGGQAFPLLRRVASMRPYEPQSYIAMAQCLADIGHADLAMVYYEVAVNTRWHDRYKDIRSIAGVEYLRLLRRINQGELSSHAPEYAKARFESLAQQAPITDADLVITMMWNTDRTDVDLHVLEPTGEECFYNHPTTRIGGHVTRDVTEGLGPEMYTLPKAKGGDYKIMANYFGSDSNRTKVRTKVYITVYRDFGNKQEQVEKKTITLSDQKEKRELTTVIVKK